MAVLRANNWSSRKSRRSSLTGRFIVRVIVLVILIHYVLLLATSNGNCDLYDSYDSVQRVVQAPSLHAPPAVDPEFVTPECTNLPSIRRTGMFFAHSSSVKQAASPEGVVPSFHIGSKISQVSNHMKSDLAHFELISKHLRANNGVGTDSVAFDVGANQGFFSYYLATLGVGAVHAFEINEENYESLQHGLLYNPKEVAERVHLYPMGLSDKIGRSGQVGKDYAGYLKETGKTNLESGPILSVTFDCFAHHMQPNLKKVAFAKVDVEGFEISVLKGAKHSLLDPSIKIGAMLMEVGPARWNRASVSLEQGTKEMADVAEHFQNAYLLLRFTGAHHRSCPPSLATNANLSDKTPEIFANVHMHKLKPEEWQPLMTEMHKSDFDCNFWFTN